MSDKDSGSIHEAIAEAVGDSQYLETIEGDDDSFDSPVIKGNQAARDDDPLASEGKAEGFDATADDDLPDEYWGTPLEGLSPGQKRSVIKALEQRDSLIQQLQHKLSEEPTPATQEPVEAEEPLSDEQILIALGFDLENTDPVELEFAKKHTLPLAKQLIAMEEQVEKVVEVESIREAATFWNTELDQLEQKYGKLPGDRVDVLRFAAQEGIGSPEILYFRLDKASATDKAVVQAEIDKIRRDEAKKSASGLRPRSTDAGTRVLDTKNKSLRDVVKEAAAEAQAESGFKWRDVLKGGRAVPSS